MNRDRDHALRSSRSAYGSMVAGGESLCRFATEAELAAPLKTVDAVGWLGNDIAGKSVLCLAAGGGRQGVLYAAAGADVTVVDLSPAMLEQDRQAAAHHGYSIRLIEGSMDDLSMLNEHEFQIVVHPVSTCYLPDITSVFAQVARVVRPGGLYISQHKTPVNLQTGYRRNANGRYEIRHSYYRQNPVPTPPEHNSTAKRLREFGAVEYLHRWEQIVGGMCRSGFVIEDLIEPYHADATATPDSFADRANHLAPYVRIKARRVGKSDALWLPKTTR